MEKPENLSENAYKVLLVIFELGTYLGNRGYGFGNPVMMDVSEVCFKRLDLNPRQFSGYMSTLTKKNYVSSGDFNVGRNPSYDSWSDIDLEGSGYDLFDEYIKEKELSTLKRGKDA